MSISIAAADAYKSSNRSIRLFGYSGTNFVFVPPSKNHPKDGFSNPSFFILPNVKTVGSFSPIAFVLLSFPGKSQNKVLPDIGGIRYARMPGKGCHFSRWP
jgi:hypothetical protein